MPSILKEVPKTVAVNLDETLAHTMESILNWHNHIYHTKYQMTDVTTFELWKVWGGSREDTCDKIRQFYQSDYFQNIVPIHDFALEALKMLKRRKFHLVIITSRQQFIAEETKKFVDKHYPGIFESIYFCNLGLSENEQLEYYSKRKSAICQEIGVDVLIDHQLEHCIDCASLGIDVLLYDRKGQYKWNHSLSGSNIYNIRRVNNWRDIINYFPKPSSPLRYCVYSHYDESNDEEEVDESNNELDDHHYHHSNNNNIQYLLIDEEEDEDYHHYND